MLRIYLNPKKASGYDLITGTIIQHLPNKNSESDHTSI